MRLCGPLTRLIPALAVALVGCGPKAADDAGDASASSTTHAGTTEATAASSTQGTTGDPACPLDQQLCVDRCLALVALDASCGRADETCYDWCVRGLYYADQGGCGAEERASYRCEAEAPALDGCEAEACASVYASADVCRGFCSHLGGVPFSGASTDECRWGSECSGGFELEMRCPATKSPTCSCLIDGEEVGTCELGVDLKPFDCNMADEGFHVLKGCCLPAFDAVLQTAPIDDRCPTGGGPAPPASPGEPCPLAGMYSPCAGGGGFVFCDQFDGGLAFGPCVAQPVCELAGPLYCDKYCGLIDGVPTWVMTECMDMTTG